MFKPAYFLLLISLIFSFLNGSPLSERSALSWQDKVDTLLLTDIASQVEFILFLEEQANLDGAAQFATKRQKGEYVFKTLTQTAQRSQKPILEFLADLELNIDPTGLQI